MYLEMDKDEIRFLIWRAQREIEIATRMLGEGHFGDAVSHAYYAVIYAARAVLLTRNIDVLEHSTILPLFDSNLIRTGEIERGYGKIFERIRAIHGVFEKYRRIRESAGDHVYVFVEEKTIKIVIEDAKKFLERMIKYLKRKKILK